MEVKIVSTKMVKPEYAAPPPAGEKYVRLSPFDICADDAYFIALAAYPPPTPPNSAFEASLRKVLAKYREFAGRLGLDGAGHPSVILNDAGALFIEATSAATHAEALGEQLSPSPAMNLLHAPYPDGEFPELMQVQFTRFSCGTLVVGYTYHHRVADGFGGISFLAAWAAQCRGIDVPPPAHDRCSFFPPRSPPLVQHPHWSTEYRVRGVSPAAGWTPTSDTVVHRAHFSRKFISELKSAAAGRYSTFECVMAHLWRAVTKARALDGGQPVRLRLAVNGRTRMKTTDFSRLLGNAVLWPICRSTAGELTGNPIGHAAAIIHGEVKKIDDGYFKSFIDFSSTTETAAAGLVPLTDPDITATICPDLDVYSWLGFPMKEMDFGTGQPVYFIPSYVPLEGVLFLVDSLDGGGGIDVYVPLFEDKLEAFKRIFPSVDLEERKERMSADAIVARL